MVIALISFLIGGVVGFIAGVKNANSSKVAIAKTAINQLKK
jgi:hypothetical protein